MARNPGERNDQQGAIGFLTALVVMPLVILSVLVVVGDPAPDFLQEG